MPTRLAAISLVGATVGTPGIIDWRQNTGGGYLAPTYKQTKNQQYAHLRFHNESGCGLDLTIPNNTDSDYMPAGGWGIITLDDDVQYINFVVSSVIPGATIAVLKCVYYPANDQTSAPFQMVLGNSPVGVGSNVVQSNTLSNEGNAPGTQVVDVGTNVTADLMTMDNSGNIKNQGTYTFDPSSVGSGFSVALQIEPTGATTTNNWQFIYNGGDGSVILYDQTHSKPVTQWEPGGDIYFNNGPVSFINGQITMGNFGVPLIVAQTNAPVTISGTGVTTILSFTPPSSGLYAIYGTFVFINPSTGTVTFKADYSDPITGGGPAAVFGCQSGYIFGLSMGSSAGTTIPTAVNTIWAGSGGAINVHFQDSSGTPGSKVSAMIVRLS